MVFVGGAACASWQVLHKQAGVLVLRACLEQQRDYAARLTRVGRGGGLAVATAAAGGEGQGQAPVPRLGGGAPSMTCCH